MIFRQRVFDEFSKARPKKGDIRPARIREADLHSAQTNTKSIVATDFVK